MPPSISPRSGRDQAYPQQPLQLIPPSSDTAYLHSTQVMHPVRRSNALPLSDGSMTRNRLTAPQAEAKLHLHAAAHIVSSRWRAEAVHQQGVHVTRRLTPCGSEVRTRSDLDPLARGDEHQCQNPKASRWERRASIGATPVRHVPCGSIIRPMLLHGTTDTLADSPVRASALPVRSPMPALYDSPFLAEGPALRHASGEASEKPRQMAPAREDVIVCGRSNAAKASGDAGCGSDWHPTALRDASIGGDL